MPRPRHQSDDGYRDDYPDHPTPRGLSSTAIALIAGGCFVTLLGGGVLVALAAAVPPGAVAPVPKAGFAALVADWELDPVATYRRYGGGPVEVTGYARRLDRNSRGQACLILVPELSSLPDDEVQVDLPRGLAAAAGGYLKSSRVTLVVRFGPPQAYMRCVASRIVCR